MCGLSRARVAAASAAGIALPPTSIASAGSGFAVAGSDATTFCSDIGAITSEVTRCRWIARAASAGLLSTSVPPLHSVRSAVPNPQVMPKPTAQTRTAA